MKKVSNTEAELKKGVAYKMNQIAGFLNELFLQNKLMKQPHFLHVDTSSQKLKVDQKFFV